MTEEESRTKWCPYVSEKITDEDDKCIASDCMMWVWDKELVNPESRSNGLIQAVYCKSMTQGHCGLTK